MANKILIVTATPYEIAPLLSHLNYNSEAPDEVLFFHGNEIKILITGIGAFAMSYQLGKLLGSGYKPDLAINAGFAGAFDLDVELGTVWAVQADTFADIGVIGADQSFLSVFDVDLIKPDQYPFEKGWIINPKKLHNFKIARAITVNTSTSTQDITARLVSKYNPDLESMEGAAFAFACALEKIDYVQIRVASNHIAPRNKLNWKIDLSISNLYQGLLELITH